MKRLWVFQNSRQKALHGDNAPWFVGYYIGRKKMSDCMGSKRDAERRLQKIRAEFIERSCTGYVKKAFSEFRAEYESKILSGKKPSTQRVARDAMDHFERLCKP